MASAAGPAASGRPLSPAAAGWPGGWDAHVHVFDAAQPVRPGHYQPAHRPLAEIEARAAAQGIGRLVIVQPSVYGSDHRVMLAALALNPGRHRAVAVVQPSIAEAELDRLQAAGVRGVRFNLVSPAGHAGDPGAALRSLAPRLRSRGLHVQWYVQPHWLPRLAEWQAETGLVFVLDHLAGLALGWEAEAGAAAEAAWRALQALAERGTWLKLSGWYRLAAEPPYGALLPTMRRLAAPFGPRLLWGSDWPHTSLAEADWPAYGALMAPVREALGEPALESMLMDSAAQLYA